MLQLRKQLPNITCVMVIK